LDVVYLNISKSFDTVSHNSLIYIYKYRLDKQTLTYVDCKLAELLGSKACDQQHEVHLEASLQWCIPGTDTGVNAA